MAKFKKHSEEEVPGSRGDVGRQGDIGPASESVEIGSRNKAVLSQPKHTKAGWAHLAPPCKECILSDGEGGNDCRARYNRTTAGCRFYRPKSKA